MFDDLQTTVKSVWHTLSKPFVDPIENAIEALKAAHSKDPKTAYACLEVNRVVKSGTLVDLKLPPVCDSYIKKPSK
jgi:hypothetical protein